MEKIDMNRVVGKQDILFVCLDSLRFDVAFEEQEKGGTPVLNRYGAWRKCYAPGNFTYPSHQAMFAGFFPIDAGIRNMRDRETLFFSEDIGMGRRAPDGAYSFRGATWIQGLEKEGYETICIGGLSFFDKRTDVGSVLPSFFCHSYWNPSFGCRVPDSTRNQVDFAIRRLEQFSLNQRVMLYLNVSAMHYPNHFYIKGAKKDSTVCHAAALRYVDRELGRLFAAFARRGECFVICCSDHGTCYGEDGVLYHGIHHPVVDTVPYKHFFLTGTAAGETGGNMAGEEGK